MITSKPISLKQEKLDKLFEYAKSNDVYYSESGMELSVVYPKLANSFESVPRWYQATFYNTNGEYCLFYDDEIWIQDIDTDKYNRI